MTENTEVFAKEIQEKLQSSISRESWRDCFELLILEMLMIGKYTIANEILRDREQVHYPSTFYNSDNNDNGDNNVV